MTTNYREYELQLYNLRTGEALFHDGTVRVTTAGSPTRAATYGYTDQVAHTNSFAFTGGKIRFLTLDTVSSVDVYGMTSKGYPFVVKALVSGARNSLLIDLNARSNVLVIPFDIADSEIIDATVWDTQFDFATGQIVQPYGLGVLMTTADATETIDIGILASESGGDADGFAALLPISGAAGSFAPIGVAIATTWWSTPTRGALLADHTSGSGTDDRGLHSPKNWVCDGTAKSLIATPTTGTDTAAGYMVIPTILMNLP